MPLVPQQNVVTVLHQGPVQGLGNSIQQALATYPPVRIVSISTHALVGSLVATVVVEAV